jgi:two-component system, NtrC family, sensor histidine kinase HydH
MTTARERDDAKLWGIAGWRAGATTLPGQFAVLSFACVALIVVALAGSISYFIRQRLLDREWAVTADFIRTEALENLAPSDFGAPGSPVAQAHFSKLHRETRTTPGIVSLKVYDAGMKIVWADEPRLIGQRFFDNAELRAALSGSRAVSFDVADLRGENVFEAADRDLVEVYVPITFPGSSRVLGVVETYKEAGQVFVKVRRAQLTVVGLAVLGGTLLYLSLFWIVRQAGRRIDVQHRALEEQSRKLAEANQELTAAEAQLLDAERMAAIGEVVAAVAHGIRNPLANIRAAAQVARLDCGTSLGPLGPRSVDNIIGQVDRLEGRLRDLLTFLRPTERRILPVDVNDIVRSARGLAAGRRSAGDIVVEERLAGMLPRIAGDPMLLEQVFVNLLGNALDAVPGGGRITLTSGTEGTNGRTRVFVEVRDSGPGIVPDELQRIFKLFYTTKAQGTGLGLPMAKKFTEAHGGMIHVDSRPGAGTAFRVALPVMAED